MVADGSSGWITLSCGQLKDPAVSSQIHATRAEQISKGVSMIGVKWDCPTCNGENTDDYEEATLLICTHCDTEVEWESILTDKQREEFDRGLAGIDGTEIGARRLWRT